MNGSTELARSTQSQEDMRHLPEDQESIDGSGTASTPRELIVSRAPAERPHNDTGSNREDPTASVDSATRDENQQVFPTGTTAPHPLGNQLLVDEQLLAPNPAPEARMIVDDDDGYHTAMTQRSLQDYANTQLAASERAKVERNSTPSFTSA